MIKNVTQPSQTTLLALLGLQEIRDLINTLLRDAGSSVLATRTCCLEPPLMAVWCVRTPRNTRPRWPSASNDPLERES